MLGTRKFCQCPALCLYISCVFAYRVRALLAFPVKPFESAGLPFQALSPSRVHTQVYLLSKHIGKEKEEIERTITRPRYFDPYEAVEYGIIDRVRPFLERALGHFQ